jgi:ribosomal protein S6
MKKEPRFLEIKEDKKGYYALRIVYIPKEYKNTEFRAPYSPVVEQNLREMITKINKTEGESKRKEELNDNLEAMLGHR